MKKIFLGLVSAFTISYGAFNGYVAHAETPQTTIQTVKPGQYKIDPYHTQVVFSVLHFGFTYYTGTFSNISGTLNLNSKHPAQSNVKITIPISSVQTTSEKLTGELKDKDWFDAEQYPNAIFNSDKVIKTGENTADVYGNLTLHGVTKPVTLHVAYIGSGVNPLDKAYTVGFNITATIKRSEFGVKTYVPNVADTVSLKIAGAFEQVK